MDLSTIINILQDSIIKNFEQFMAVLPQIVGAVLLLVVGLILGRLVSSGIKHLLDRVGLDNLVSKTGIFSYFYKTAGQQRISHAMSLLVFWIIFFLFLISATEVLGLALLSQALTGLVFYLPKIGLALLILIIGIMGNNWIRELITLACESAGVRQGVVIAQTIFVAGTLLVLVTAINELGIDTSLLNQIILLLVAGLIAGSALSFGYGARSAVRNLIASHYIQPIIRIGDHIEAGGHTGTITAVTPLLIVMETERGRVVLPATQFTESATVINPRRD